MRYAVYFTPAASHPLTGAGARWLGRDAFTGAAFAPAGAARLPASRRGELTQAARRYGFHATLKAPFRLAPGRTEGELSAAIERLAERTAPVVIPRLVIARLGGFFALVPAEPVTGLNRLAGEVVAELDGFRAPLTEAERARRKPDDLPPRQRENLDRWGYPHVFEDFHFHMTLTDSVPEAEAGAVAAALDEAFRPLLSEPVAVDALALFVEPRPGADFTVRSLHPLRGPDGA